MNPDCWEMITLAGGATQWVLRHEFHFVTRQFTLADGSVVTRTVVEPCV